MQFAIALLTKHQLATSPASESVYPLGQTIPNNADGCMKTVKQTLQYFRAIAHGYFYVGLQQFWTHEISLTHRLLPPRTGKIRYNMTVLKIKNYRSVIYRVNVKLSIDYM